MSVRERLHERLALSMGTFTRAGVDLRNNHDANLVVLLVSCLAQSRVCLYSALVAHRLILLLDEERSARRAESALSEAVLREVRETQGLLGEVCSNSCCARDAPPPPPAVAIAAVSRPLLLRLLLLLLLFFPLAPPLLGHTLNASFYCLIDTFDDGGTRVKRCDVWWEEHTTATATAAKLQSPSPSHAQTRLSLGVDLFFAAQTAPESYPPTFIDRTATGHLSLNDPLFPRKPCFRGFSTPRRPSFGSHLSRCRRCGLYRSIS